MGTRSGCQGVPKSLCFAEPQDWHREANARGGETTGRVVCAAMPAGSCVGAETRGGQEVKPAGRSIVSLTPLRVAHFFLVVACVPACDRTPSSTVVAPSSASRPREVIEQLIRAHH